MRGAKSGTQQSTLTAGTNVKRDIDVSAVHNGIDVVKCN